MRINLEHGNSGNREDPKKTQKPIYRGGPCWPGCQFWGGCAAAVTLGVRQAEATPVADAGAGKAKDLAETHAAGEAKDFAGDKALAEGKKAEPVGGRDPDDALEFSAQTPGMTRRQTRRTARRVRRTTRRTARRVRRATRRGSCRSLPPSPPPDWKGRMSLPT